MIVDFCLHNGTQVRESWEILLDHFQNKFFDHLLARIDKIVTRSFAFFYKAVQIAIDQVWIQKIWKDEGRGFNHIFFDGTNFIM